MEFFLLIKRAVFIQLIKMSEKISTIFFGTHNFAAKILQGLIDDPRISVDLVITQPDKPVGRKQELQKPAVKILAEKYNLKILQPPSLKNFDFKILEAFDLGICAQYGLLIPENILNAPKHGIINVHTSLLPKYRGASPIQSALINGESETGITIMKMDKGLDTGPIILQKTIKIEPDDIFPDLDEKLSQIAILALLEAVFPYVTGQIQPQTQDNAQATNCREFNREDGRIDWLKTAQEIYNQYRGLTPWPGIWTTLGEKRLKLLKIKPSQQKVESGKLKVENGEIYIGCKENSIEILELQLEGSKPMDTKNFINGFANLLKNSKIK